MSDWKSKLQVMSKGVDFTRDVTKIRVTFNGMLKELDLDWIDKDIKKARVNDKAINFILKIDKETLTLTGTYNDNPYYSELLFNNKEKTFTTETYFGNNKSEEITEDVIIKYPTDDYTYIVEKLFENLVNNLLCP